MKNVHPPHVVDVHVGQRLRVMRREVGFKDRIWVRPASEFHDGRFRKLRPSDCKPEEA